VITAASRAGAPTGVSPEADAISAEAQQRQGELVRTLATMYEFLRHLHRHERAAAVGVGV